MPRSSNGYLASPYRDEINVKDFSVGGVFFPAGVRGGDVYTILHYVAEQLATQVERPRPGWCWGYSYRPNRNNPNELSDHSSGTAIDWNAPAHPNGKFDTFSHRQQAEIRKILNFCYPAVKWGGDYRATKDEMHFGISDEASPAEVAAVARKIRARKRSQSRTQKVVAKTKRVTRRGPRPAKNDGTVTLSNIQPGRANKDVLEVQRVLNRWYPNLRLKEDGVYGPRTVLAMVKAARGMGLMRRPVSGSPTVTRKVLRGLGFKVDGRRW